MRARHRIAVAAATTALMALLGTVLAAPASSAQLVEVTGFGANPTNLRMHLYVPDNVGSRPPVLLAIHYCTGSGPALHSGTEFASLADRHKFIVVYPSATRSGACFDVSSPQALRRDGGSDPVGIMSMVRHVHQPYGGDPDRTYVTGVSSGAMMTNVMLGNYPAASQAGAASADAPSWRLSTTAGTSRNRPCATAASTLRSPHSPEQIKQWPNVHGLSQTPSATDTPQPGPTRTRYGDTGGTAPVEAISIQGAGHDLPRGGMAAETIRFFGLDSGGGPTTTPTATPPARPRPVPYTTNPWNTGLTTAATITNESTTPIDGWSLTFTLPAGQTITGAWNATITPSSGQVTATNAPYNAAIAPGATATFGFQATHSGNTAAPSAFTLNGETCTTP